MRTMEFPDVNLTTDGGAADYIASLYRQLGWDGGDELDPTKILINRDQWREVCTRLNASEKGLTAGYTWVNYGPSVSDRVRYGEVLIEDGAFEQRASLDSLKAEAKERVAEKNATRHEQADAHKHEPER